MYMTTTTKSYPTKLNHQHRLNYTIMFYQICKLFNLVKLFFTDASNQIIS